MQDFKPDTLCIHAGYTPKNGEPRVAPIVQSTTYVYESSKEMGDLFDLQAEGFFYTRLANPTLDAVEKKIAALEGGVGAMLTSSGQAANLMAVLNICPAGFHVVSSSAIYGGTFNLFYKTMKEMGIETTFVPPTATLEELRAAMRPNTRAVFAETLANPSLAIADLEVFAQAAHEQGVPLIVDNTFPTPINCRPIEFGADIVTHSTTKYMDGHAVQVGGVIVDSGNFNWDNGKFPMLTQPDESYHGVVYTRQFGKAAYITKARTHLMRDLGAQAAPMNAFLLNLGLETLALRMERHCSNALKVAQYLEADPRVAWVDYPDLEGNPNHALAQKYMPHGTCGVVSFGVKGGREAATKFMDGLEMASVVTHVADLRTCVPPPGQHHPPADERRAAAGGRRGPRLRFACPWASRTPTTSWRTSTRPWRRPPSNPGAFSQENPAQSKKDIQAKGLGVLFHCPGAFGTGPCHGQQNSSVTTCTTSYPAASSGVKYTSGPRDCKAVPLSSTNSATGISSSSGAGALSCKPPRMEAKVSPGNATGSLEKETTPPWW